MIVEDIGHHVLFLRALETNIYPVLVLGIVMFFLGMPSILTFYKIQITQLTRFPLMIACYTS